MITVIEHILFLQGLQEKLSKLSLFNAYQILKDIHALKLCVILKVNRTYGLNFTTRAHDKLIPINPMVKSISYIHYTVHYFI